MSSETEKVAPSTETESERKSFPEDLDVLLAIPAITGVAVMLFGSLFIIAASPAPGSFAFGAVASTMVGVLVIGFASVVSLLVVSVVAPRIAETPKHEAS